MDTGPEQAYDDIVRLAATLCDVPAAAISLIDHDRQWFKAQIGLDARQTPREEAICDRLIMEPGRTLVIEDLSAQVSFPRPKARIGKDPLRFYAGTPLMSPDGHAIGTVCVLDTRPRTLSRAQVEGLEVLARQTQHLLELRRYALEQRRLLSEREAFAQRLEDARADLQRRNDLLEHSATHDALTGLLNRAALAQLRDNPEAMRQLQQAPYSLMLLDVDHFKDVNDRHGHLLGDRALRAVADAVAASIRHGDVAVRYGGEEFLILLPDTRLESAAQVAERIRQRLSQAALPFALTVSIGLAAGEPTRDWSEQVFDRADQALYRAKARGRNCIVADDTPLHGV
ncbi:sensor domain-containing diguanylate cyclase [Lysobacter sp. S4-A87]|uniref:sensor domain-containing diguanylate cyclase n=1 Tax=Lysobacter sp. S4-A87 TaxID=2925843 RepID=UPI001F53744C|nr:sensor domain-containing diguanylate cyclase [Lysobacter sp. S4-A87]UNK48819.1 sensor domain-containing diguanylate cyclase [Lysobacter sp. S4-A87]